MIAWRLTKGCMLFNTFTELLTIYMKLVWFKMERNVKTAKQRKNGRYKKKESLNWTLFPWQIFFQLVSLAVLMLRYSCLSFIFFWSACRCKCKISSFVLYRRFFFSTNFFKNLKSRIMDVYSKSSRMFFIHKQYT